MNPPANLAELKVPHRPRKRLAGPELEAYCEAASRLILAGRLNRWYPDPYGCANYMRGLAPSMRDGVYDGVWIDLASGMPTLQEIVLVKADRDVCGEFLKHQAMRQQAGRPATPKVAAKTEYLLKLSKLEFPTLTRLEVKLRRIDQAKQAASFEAVYDRYDPAENVFTRYTLLLQQHDSALSDALIERSGDYSRQTERFRQTMDKYLADESEIAFLLLGRIHGVRVEEVTRARIGPLWSAWAGAPPGWLPDGGEGEFILHLPWDKASVDLEADRDNDPFGTIYRQFLSEHSRPLVEDEARRLGYRVHKERKFVCTPGALPLLKEKLRQAGTSNIIYTI